MIGSDEQSHEQIRIHGLYIEELARKETQNMVNARRGQRIVLDRDGADKARKLCRLLIDTDRQDQRPRMLMRAI